MRGPQDRFWIVLVAVWLGAGAGVGSARADVVTDANAKAAEIASRHPATPIAVRTMAIVQVSVFEAANAVTGRYPPYRAKLTAAPGASVEVDLARDLPMLELDPVLFEQVLFNLLDNAAKYASPQTTVLIQGWQEDETVKLRVVDEGSGIPPEELDRIFDKFHRAEKQDQVRAGTGLGLAISRGFIEAMGGSIAAANRTDRPGAVFTITLPVPKPAARLDTAA